MLKKRWIVMSVLVAVFAVGGAGSVVLGQEETEAGSPVKNLISRVATILGLEEQAVQDAVDQAMGEIHDKALQAQMEQLVEEGRLTQEQADEYLEWQRARPDTLNPGFGMPGPFGGRHGHGTRGFGRGGPRGFGGHGFKYGPPATDSAEADDTVRTSA